jgi:hypothetical protein
MNFANNCSDIKTIRPIRSIPLNEIGSLMKSKKNYPTINSFDELLKHNDDYCKFVTRVLDIDRCIQDLNGSLCININGIKSRCFQDVFFDNFEQYLEPISSLDPWNQERMAIFVKLIYRIRQSTTQDMDILVLSESVIEQWFPDAWIYGGKDCVPTDHFAKTFLDAWYNVIGHGYVNIYPIKKLIQDISMYCLVDNSLVIYYLLQGHNELARLVDHSGTRVLECMDGVKDDMILQDLIQIHGYEGLYRFFPEYQFDLVFKDPGSRMILRTMHQAIQEIEGAEKWMIKQGTIAVAYDSGAKFTDRLIFNAISRHPEVEKCGHSGMSMSWGLGTLKSIYKDGWNNWLRSTLACRGIGITRLSFDAGVEMGMENVCMYWFETGIRDGKLISDRYPDIEAWCAMINEKHFGKILELLLKNFGNHLTSEKYFNILQMLYKKCEWGLYNVYKKYWVELYGSDVWVDCRAINKPALIMALWKRLPARSFSGDSSIQQEIPGLDEINRVLESKSGIYELGGKDFHFIGSNGCWDKVETFYFDIAMQRFGAFKSICAEIAAMTCESS